MTELEQLLLTNLERLESGLQSRMKNYETTLVGVEARLRELEQHAPQLGVLCEELQQLLQHLNNEIRR